MNTAQKMMVTVPAEMARALSYRIEINAVVAATFADLVDAVAWGLWERTRRRGPAW